MFLCFKLIVLLLRLSGLVFLFFVLVFPAQPLLTDPIALGRRQSLQRRKIVLTIMVIPWFTLIFYLSLCPKLTVAYLFIFFPLTFFSLCLFAVLLSGSFCVCFVLFSKHSLVLAVPSLLVFGLSACLTEFTKVITKNCFQNLFASAMHNLLIFTNWFSACSYWGYQFSWQTVFWCLPRSYQFAASLVFIVADRNIKVQHYEKCYSLKLGDGVQETFVGAHP